MWDYKNRKQFIYAVGDEEVVDELFPKDKEDFTCEDYCLARRVRLAKELEEKHKYHA